MFLDDTACNLASMNLLAFHDETTGELDVEGYEHAIRLWTVVLEIPVSDGAVPSRGDRGAPPMSSARPRPRLRNVGGS